VHICGDFHTVRPFGCKDMTKYKRGCFFMKHRVVICRKLLMLTYKTAFGTHTGGDLIQISRRSFAIL